MTRPLLATPKVVVVHREGVNPVFGEGVIEVCLDDEGGGPFILLKQDVDNMPDTQVIRADLDELRRCLIVAEQMISRVGSSDVEFLQSPLPDDEQ